MGFPCSEPSQIWAIAAMILCWIKPGILGEWDSPHPLLNAAWCMAKIKRVFPNWIIPSQEDVEGCVLKGAVKSVKRISEEEPDMLKLPPFDSEMQAMNVLLELRDIL